MPHNRSINKALAFLFFCIPFVSVSWLLLTPTDPKTAVLFGWSIGRIGLALGIFLFGTYQAIMAWGWFFGQRWVDLLSIDKTKLGKWDKVMTGSGLLLLIVAWTNPVGFGIYAITIDRFRPLALLAGSSLLLLGLGHQQLTDQAERWVNSVKAILSTHKWLFAGCLLVILCFFALSTILYPDGIREDYWWESPVPLALWQIVASILFGWAGSSLFSKINTPTRRFVLLGLFLVAGTLWAMVPITPSFFNPKPLPPSESMFPWSDAADFDLQAQASLQGYGLRAGQALDRPFYPTFLAILHAIGGQDYATIARMQAFAFAIFALLLYLIGSELLGYGLGLTAFASATFWGINLLNNNAVLNTATPMQFLSDFPAALGLALTIWLGLRWAKDEQTQASKAILAGAAIGLSALIRYSILGFLPFLVLIPAFKLRKQWPLLIRQWAAFALGLTLVIVPWTIRNITVDSEYKLPFMSKITFILEHRYSAVIHEKTKASQIEATATPVTGTTPTEQAATATTANNNTDAGESKPDKTTKSAKNWFGAHFVHNIISPLYVLPGQAVLQPLATSMAADPAIWDYHFNGWPLGASWFVYLLQLVIFSFGLIAIYRKDRLSAFLLLAAFVGVAFTNTLGRTSGGRYIVPTTWVVFIIYLAAFTGIFSKRDEKANDATQSTQPSGWRPVVIAAAIALAIGLLPILWEGVASQLYKAPQQASFEWLMQQGKDRMGNQEPDRLRSLVESENGVILTGAAIYPIQTSGKIAKSLGYTNIFEGKEVVMFYMISPQDTKHIIFDYDKNLILDPMHKVAIIGCEFKNAVIASGVWVYKKSGNALYLRANTKITNCSKSVFFQATR